MKLRITADDLGLTKGINYGIYDVCLNGVVNCVSLMMNLKHTQHGFDLIKKLNIPIGVHLNVTTGMPLEPCDKLTEFGYFKPVHDFNLVIDAIESEYTHQIEKALSMGIAIEHLSTYDDLQFTHGEINELLLKLGEKYSIPVRNSRPFTDIIHGQMVQLDTFQQLLFQNVESLEIRVLPGFLDGHLIDISDYREMRMVEHSLLTSDYLKRMLLENKVTFY